MDYENIIYEKANGIATITLNRPSVLNAVNYPMMAELGSAIASSDCDPSVRVVILRGAGRVFSSGADVKEMDDLVGDWKHDPHAYIRHIESKEHALLLALRKLEKPTIASIRGYAIGVASGMAMCCDMRVITDEAKFGLTFVRMGLVPGDGDLAMLPALVGYGHAMEYLLTGRYITAEDAYRMGLANRVAKAEELDTVTLELAEEVLQAAPRAVASVKTALNRVLLPALRADLEFSVRAQSLLKQTADCKEALIAFLEKRRANFIGR
jgi:enoyl-CoA hydratase/carnithine racemase